jgi:hypothetical protein
MSVISLSEETELKDIPKPQPLYPQFRDITERVEESERLVAEEVTLANGILASINKDKKGVDQQLAHAKAIQDARKRFGTIAGTALAILLGLEVIQGGCWVWKWFKDRRDKAARLVTEEHSKKEDDFTGKRRRHAREWNVSRIT